MVNKTVISLIIFLIIVSAGVVVIFTFRFLFKMIIFFWRCCFPFSRKHAPYWFHFLAMKYSRVKRFLKRNLVLFGDGNGTVEFKELLSAMTILSSESDEQKAEMLFDLWDADGNGTLDKNEVMQMIHSTIVVTANILMNEHLKSVKTMRNMKDAQKGGEEDTKKLIQANISREEVQQIVDQMFDEVDVNQDGVLSKEEFRAHCKSSNNATAQFVSGLQDILKPQKGGGCSIF